MPKVKLEQLAGDSEEGTVECWCCQEGELVAEGDDLLQIDTLDGPVMIKSEYSGTVKEIYFAEGETVGLGDVLCEIDESDEE